MPRNCKYCSKEFVALKGNVKKGKGNYCSKVCSNRGNSLGFRSGHQYFGTPESRKAGGLSQRGKLVSPETRKKISEKNKGRKGIKGEANVGWKGEKVSYSGLHIWARLYLPKSDTCEFCKKSGLSGHAIHWANKSQKYKRVPSDWLRLCAKCHKQYDLKYA